MTKDTWKKTSWTGQVNFYFFSTKSQHKFCRDTQRAERLEDHSLSEVINLISPHATLCFSSASLPATMSADYLCSRSYFLTAGCGAFPGVRLLTLADWVYTCPAPFLTAPPPPVIAFLPQFFRFMTNFHTIFFRL